MSSENKVTNQEREKIMGEIESKTEKKVLECIKTKQLINPRELIGSINQNKKDVQKSQDIIMDIMKEGENEFKKKMGRPMTYSEMRAMFG